MTDIDFDAVLAKIGERGRYQNRLFFVLSLTASLPAVFLYFNQVFASATPEHWCRVPELENVLGVEASRQIAIPYTLLSDGKREYSRCEKYDVNFTNVNLTVVALTPDPNWNRTTCTDGWHYDRTYFDETLVSEMDLVCDKSWWPATSTTFFGIGSLVGNVLLGLERDMLGRRPVLLIVVTWHIVFSISTPIFTKNYFVYTVFRALNGLVHPAIYQVPFVIALEIMGSQERTFAGMMMCVFYAIALVIQSLITFWLRHWHSLLLYTSLPWILLFGYYWIIPESPRWLLSKGRIDEAEIIVQRIAKVNGHSVPSNFLRSFQRENSNLKEIQTEKFETKVDFRHILRSSILRRCFLLISVIWVTNAVVYSGLAFSSGNLGVRDQTAFLIGAGVEMLGYVASWWAMDRYGRRAVIWSFMLFGGLSCVSCGFVPLGKVWITVFLAMIGRFAVAGSFAVFYVYMGELLPTVVRVQSMALGSFISNIGRVMFPYIVYLANYWRVLPLLVFGLLSIIGAVATMVLPETLGRPLPQTLKDGEALHAKSTKSSHRQVYIKAQNNTTV